MNRRVFLIGFLLLVCFQFIFGKEDTAKISYEVSPMWESNEPRLKIRLSFKGYKTGVTTIKLPLEFGGQEQLFKGIQNLKVTTAEAKLSETEKPEIKNIHHQPNQNISLEYELIQDWPGNPVPGGASMNAGGGYRPILKKEYFHILGNGTWILPNLSEEAKLAVSITWKDFPAEWKFANSFGANQTKQNFRTQTSSFLSSVFVGGDFRLSQRMVKGKPVWTAIRGKWNFSDEEFANLVQKIIETERGFWRESNHPFYLVTALPLSGENAFSAGGTGLTNSFATFMTTNLRLENISFLLAHEYFHNWNTIAFGGMREPEALLYWFSEGFTDYYTYQLLFRAGLISAERYVSQYNEFLNDYYLSEVRNVDNQRVLADFFKNYDVSKLPYRRGFLLATKWNQLIRQQSNGKKSLDEVMRNILRDARRGQIKQISKDYLLSVLSKYAKYDFAADVEKYVENGETIGDLNQSLGNCLETYEVQSGRYELGFNGNSLKDNLVSGVVKDSLAYQAGLRDGQKLVGYSVHFGDPTKLVQLTIEVDGQKKKIGFMPQSKEKIAVPQFKLKENLSTKEKIACL